MYIELDKAVTTIVDTVLPRFSPEDIGLFVSCDVTYFERRKDKKNEDEYRDYRRELNFMFHRSSNYTKVFFLTENRVEDNYFSTIYRRKFAEKFADKWDLIGYHDSCWRDDLHRKIREVGKELMEKSGQDYPLRAADSFVSFGILGPHLCHVELTRVAGSNDCRPWGKYNLVVTGRVPERTRAVEYIASTCPVDELPLLISYNNPCATEEQNKKIQEIAKARLQNIEKTRSFVFG